MFEKMVVSSAGRSERRMGRYLVGTFLLYGLILAAALALSVALADPRLAIAASATKVFAIYPGPQPGGPPPSRLPHPSSAAPNPLHAAPLELLYQHPNRPLVPMPPSLDRFDIVSDGPGTGPGIPGDGVGPGTGYGLPNQLPVSSPEAPMPKPPKPPVDKPKDRAPLMVSGTILQGKAIERKIPDYPQLARQIHLEGQVVVEVVISPDGRVESAHAVSGHPLLIKAAADAAWGWRFQPTMLGDVPVRVTGVLTFVFKF